MDRAWLNLGPTLMFLGLMSAEGHLNLALAVPGSPWAGPYDPVGAPYSRRGHGRLRRPFMQFSGVMILNSVAVSAFSCARNLFFSPSTE